MKIIGVIPARYQSSRFPGKPLADICGKPMVWWVYHRAIKAEQISEVYVAVDDERVKEVCEKYNIPYVMTSKNHLTGVDRLVEVAQKVKADRYILIQGDEPLLEPDTITELVKEAAKADENTVVTFKTLIHEPVDVVNFTIIKIVTDLKDLVLLASRSPIPYPKDSISIKYYKSVGVYSYPFSVLNIFPSLEIGPIEKAEGHDFMRLLENGIKVKAITHETITISVDTPKDLERVRKIMGGQEAN